MTWHTKHKPHRGHETLSTNHTDDTNHKPHRGHETLSTNHTDDTNHKSHRGHVTLSTNHLSIQIICIKMMYFLESGRIWV
jgi:hypothetical protein